MGVAKGIKKRMSGSFTHASYKTFNKETFLCISFFFVLCCLCKRFIKPVVVHLSNTPVLPHNNHLHPFCRLTEVIAKRLVHPSVPHRYQTSPLHETQIDKCCWHHKQSEMFAAWLDSRIMQEAQLTRP